MKAIRTVNCPSCGTGVAWVEQSRFRPFCSARCKLMDLGAWATERYRVASEDEDDDSSDAADQPPSEGERGEDLR